MPGKRAENDEVDAEGALRRKHRSSIKGTAMQFGLLITQFSHLGDARSHYGDAMLLARQPMLARRIAARIWSAVADRAGRKRWTR